MPSLSAELSFAASPRMMRLPRLMLMSVLTLGIVAGLNANRGHAPVLKLATVERISQAAAKVKPAKPAPPSVFMQEAAMTPRELIARWQPTIAAAAKEFHLSADWIRAVMRMESGGRTMLAENQPITSEAGAMGLMQVMPETYADMRVQYGLGADAYDAHDNIYAGAAYLRALYRKYGYPAMFAAYNDGPGNLENHLAGRRDLPDETRNYVKGVTGMLGGPAAIRTGVVATGATLQLTRPDGSAFAVDAGTVRAVRKPMPGEYADGVQAVVTIGKKHQGVREDLATVARLTLGSSEASM